MNLYEKEGELLTKPDDSNLNPDDLRLIEARARDLLDRAAAWDRFPAPIDDMLSATNLKVASSGMFDPAMLLAYLKGKAGAAVANIKSAVSKVFGVFDAGDNIIHIDNTVVAAKQTFLKLHEIGHHDIPAHKKLFRFFQECEKTLTPEIADQFEREANNFARFALFKGDTFMRHAADCAFEIKTPIKLAKKFGASIYASAREFARTNQRACAIYVLEPVEFAAGVGARAAVRRIEVSPAFKEQFGAPLDTEVILDHPLGPILPIGKKMTYPTKLVITDRNGDSHECLAEAFDTSYNIIILLYPVNALAISIGVLDIRSTSDHDRLR